MLIKRNIDLNCDLGEMPSRELDQEIFPYLSSCNIAAGGHAGDKKSMQETILLALEKEVAIGIHPSYPDKAHFGRKSLQMPLSTLKDAIKNQVLDFLEILENSGGHLHHIKAHGALYHDLAESETLANLYLELLQEFVPNVMIYGPIGGYLQSNAGHFRFKYAKEGFADRAYLPDLKLMDRSLPNAVLFEEENILKQVHSLVLEGNVNTERGKVNLKIDTLCLHSDTPAAVHHARSIFQYLKQHHVDIISPQ